MAIVSPNIKADVLKNFVRIHAYLPIGAGWDPATCIPYFMIRGIQSKLRFKTLLFKN
jgi:hypothetical protein